ncbi:MAG: rod shape-determining protein RodA [Clostridiales bacterium]|nr:rod shape-determining protein RodA [Clostridiales bacterium]
MEFEKRRKIAIDYWLIAIVFVLMIFGIFMLANATGKPEVEEGANWLQYFSEMNKFFIGRHALWFGLGCVLAIIVAFFDYKIYGELYIFIYGLALIMLLSVVIFGEDVMGQKRLEIGPIEVQPSEVAKIALIITLAWDLSKREKGIQKIRDLLFLLLKVLIPLGLILMQPDLGTALVYVFITVVMLVASNTKGILLGGLTVSSVIAIVPIWQLFLEDEQKTRILTFLDPSMDPLGSGYNVIHSKTAIGSGQMLGKGFFNPSALSQLNYIPVQKSDFIFAVTGETVGFWWSAIIILVFAALIIRMMMLAMRTQDKFGSYLIIGVAAMMFFHIFENIGMSIGLMPVTGIPLPFFSYGGSSMWANMIGIGVVQGVYLRHKRRRT